MDRTGKITLIHIMKYVDGSNDVIIQFKENAIFM